MEKGTAKWFSEMYIATNKGAGGSSDEWRSLTDNALPTLCRYIRFADNLTVTGD
jgi:hypothetical protein